MPANIGIDQFLWKDRSLDKYGVEGKSPLATHDASGTIYVESNTARNFTFYEFLAVWGKSIDYTQVVGYPVQSGQSACKVVDGQVIPNLRDVIFADGQKIIFEIVSTSRSAIGQTFHSAGGKEGGVWCPPIRGYSNVSETCVSEPRTRRPSNL